jgi:hypothetical protein
MRVRSIVLLTMVVATAACGESPLQSLGNRSSNWINEPKVTTTLLRVDLPSLFRSVAALVQ